MMSSGAGITKREDKRRRREIADELRSLGVRSFSVNDDMTVTVTGDVDISRRGLSSLPPNVRFQRIRGSFDASENKFSNMRGFPTIIDGNLFVHKNNLTSLDGCPLEVRGKFFCHANPRRFMADEVMRKCEVDYVYV